MSSAASSSTSSTSVTLKFDDSSYEIDLSKPDAAPLRAALASYVASQRESESAGRTREGASAAPPSNDEWVKEVGAR